MLDGLKLLITTIPSDSHTWNLVYLQLLFEEHHGLVRNLGSCVPVVETISAIQTFDPDLIVVSTVNGHASHQGRVLVAAIDEALPGRRSRAVIGGKLSTSVGHHLSVKKELMDAGYDDVFYMPDAIEQFLRYASSLPRRDADFPLVVGGPLTIEPTSVEKRHGIRCYG